ncbi:hypothetical protein GSI_04559 [Ganoderma sinense ZZ0214-1]|uniref:Uncharacterized protein n=1 Tax=Ganoderma sinense ZZ0214-1 TaxID=1077348 RepID=A0A2G8SH60_9APHY|nr:hypothetical protein GSI_04559 [Ganoderma sinense ZZ0214-1]
MHASTVPSCVVAPTSPPSGSTPGICGPGRGSTEDSSRIDLDDSRAFGPRPGVISAEGSSLGSRDC